MTVEKARFGGELDLPSEVEEMMAKITELTGVAGIFIQLRPLDEPGSGPDSGQGNGKIH